MAEVVIKSGRAPKSEVLLQVEELMPQPVKGMEGSSVRKRKDAAKIAAEIVMQTRPQKDIATAYNITLGTLRQFRKNFVTTTVRHAVLQSVDILQAEAASGVTEVQGMMRESLYGVMEELHDLYRVAKAHLDTQEGDEYLARLTPLVKLLDQQGKTVQRMADAMHKSAKSDTLVTPLSEHPDMAPLMDALVTLFREFPEARARFKEIQTDRKLLLNTE